jgi:hypothetical protein
MGNRRRGSALLPAFGPFLVKRRSAVAAIAAPAPLDRIEIGTAPGTAMTDEPAEEAREYAHE